MILNKDPVRSHELKPGCRWQVIYLDSCAAIPDRVRSTVAVSDGTISTEKIATSLDIQTA